MKITAEKDQQSQYVVRIEVDAAELEEAKGRAARKLSNQLRIPGFRPGKAPRALVERFVGQEALLEQASKDLLPKAYKNAIEQENITPIADPQFNIESLNPLTIVATIPVEPTVELGQYQEIRLDLEPVNITDEDVNKVLQNLVEQQSTWEEPETERSAQEGDQVEIELQTIREGEVVGEPFQRTGILGKGELLGQIDDQVQGMNVGQEKIIEVKRQPTQLETAEESPPETADDEVVPALEPEQIAEGEAYKANQPEQNAGTAEELALDLPEVETLPMDEEEETGPMTFKAVLSSIKIKHSPELDDDFAKSASDAQTLEELKDRVRTNLQTQGETDKKRELTELFIKEAVVLSNIVMPPVMVDAEIHAMEDNIANRLKQQKISLDQYLSYTGKDHTAFHEELRPQAVERIRTALVLREMARLEGVTVEEGDLDREVEKMVDEFTAATPEEQREEQLKAMRGYLNQEQTRTQLRDEIFSRKMSERLIEIATDGKVKPAAVVEVVETNAAFAASIGEQAGNSDLAPNDADEIEPGEEQTGTLEVQPVGSKPDNEELTD